MTIDSLSLALLALAALFPSGDGAAWATSPASRSMESSPVLTTELLLAQQPNPNQDRFLPGPQEPAVVDQDTRPVLPEVDDGPVVIPPGEAQDPSTDAPTDPSTILFVADRIVVDGSTALDAAELRAIVAPLEGQAITLSDLRAAADAITQRYLDAGYLTSRAIVPDQTITDGIARLQVIEGRISNITVDGTRRLRQRYIRNRIQLGVETPLRTDRLEDQLRLLRANPLIDSIEASLRASEEPGESTLRVSVVEADAWVGEVRLDNYSPPSVGSERVGAELAYRNLAGLGDTLSVSVDRTTQGGSTLVEAGYQVPLNAMDGTLQLRTLINRNEIITGPFTAFDIEGESELYEVSFRQPLLRSPREELAVSVGFSYRDGQTLISGFALPDLDSRTSVFRFGQDYINRDRQGAWALRSQFSLGADIFDATVSDDGPDSRFLSWLGQAQRVQRLDANQVLVVQLDLQLTPDALLSSEDFVVGGGLSVRGFRQNARAGDNGVRFSIEDRITLVRDESGAATFQLRPFVDVGAVWNDSDGEALPEQRVLAGIGVGALWEMLPDLSVRVDLAAPLVDLDDRGENAQDSGVHFSVNYRI